MLHLKCDTVRLPRNFEFLFSQECVKVLIAAAYLDEAVVCWNKTERPETFELTHQTKCLKKTLVKFLNKHELKIETSGRCECDFEARNGMKIDVLRILIGEFVSKIHFEKKASNNYDKLDKYAFMPALITAIGRKVPLGNGNF